MTWSYFVSVAWNNKFSQFKIVFGSTQNCVPQSSRCGLLGNSEHSKNVFYKNFHKSIFKNIQPGPLENCKFPIGDIPKVCTVIREKTGEQFHSTV